MLIKTEGIIKVIGKFLIMNQYNLFKWRFTIDNEITEILGVAFELLDLILIEHIQLTRVKSCSLFLFKNSLKSF